MVGLQPDVVGRRRRLLLERRAAVLALDDVDAGQPDALVVVRIDRRLAVVHRPRIGRAHPLPRRAGVLGAVGAAGRGVLDRRDEHVRLRPREREADASLVAGRNAVLELLPRGAGVGALVDRAARTAAVEAERLAQPLIGRGVEHFRVARVHHEVGRAGERVDVEHLRPGAAGVGRLEDAALGVPASRGCRPPRRRRRSGPRDRAPRGRSRASRAGRDTSTSRRRRWSDRRRRPTTSSGDCSCSPVPAQMIFGSRSKIASAPNVLSGCLPKTSFQVTPLLTDFQMPPEAAPTYSMAGFFGSIWRSWMRPPVAAGPMSRKCSASKGRPEQRPEPNVRPGLAGAPRRRRRARRVRSMQRERQDG